MMSSSHLLLQRLQALAVQSPDLKDAVRLYEVILPIIEAADLHAEPVSISPDQARAKLAGGFPLLHDVKLHLDYAEARSLMLKLASALEKVSKSRRYACRRIGQALEEDKLEMSLLMTGIAAGDEESVRSIVQPLGLDAGLVWTLARYVFRPAMHAWRRQLSPLIEGAPWSRGHCPICGSLPVLGELQNNHLSKHLRCGQCGADWPFRRMQCLYCENEDHLALGYLYEESRQDTMRVEICNRCRGYLKVIVSFTATPPEHLSIEDLATLHLDYIAEGRGYRRTDLKPLPNLSLACR
jgi:FdhE protein